MSEPCCGEQERSQTTVACPSCASAGAIVEWLTVSALVTALVPPKQRFWVCSTAACEVVYFGEAGARFRLDDLRAEPGFKNVGPEGLVCYCFLRSRGEIERDLRSTGATSVGIKITAQIKACNCACEVRNPTGRCCLGQVNSEISAAKERLAVDDAA